MLLILGPGPWGTCTQAVRGSFVNSRTQGSPLVSNCTCPRAPVIHTHPPGPTLTLNQSTKIQGNFYFQFSPRNLLWFFMLLVLFLFFFFFHFILFYLLSGWSRWVPGIKKMPTEVAVSRPGARPTLNTPKKEKRKHKINQQNKTKRRKKFRSFSSSLAGPTTVCV